MSDSGEGLGLGLGLDIVLVSVILHVQVYLTALRLPDQLHRHLPALRRDVTGRRTVRCHRQPANVTECYTAGEHVSRNSNFKTFNRPLATEG